MFCKNCGNEIKDGAKFCPGCGAELAEAPAEQEAPQAATTPAEPVEVVNEAKIPQKKPKKLGKLIPIIAAALVAGFVFLVAFVVVIIMIFNSKGYEKEVENYLNFYAEQSTDAAEFIDFSSLISA